MTAPDKVFFASDFHLGVPDKASSQSREKKVVEWLDKTCPDARAYYLVGDIFDFWFEYKKVVPKGYVRLLGKLAEISDSGTELHIFTGNHDLWMDGYFQQEFNASVYHMHQTVELDGKKFLIAHGDGLGPGDRGFKAMKKVFTNKGARSLFRLLHPDWGIAIADYFSGKSRKANENKATHLEEPENDNQIIFAREYLTKEHIHYFIFGHRHIPYDYSLNNDSRVINLGDWMQHFTYAEWDGKSLKLRSFNE